MHARRKFKYPSTWLWLVLIILLGASVITIFWLTFSFRQNDGRSLSTESESLDSIPQLNEDISVRSVQALDSTSPSTASGNSLLSDIEDAPNFTLNTLNDTTVSLSDYVDQPVIINFWASWCAPCRVEMPALIEAYETYQDDGLVILGLNTTFQDNIGDARAFVDEFEIPFPILLDLDGYVTTELYTIFGLPTTYFVAPPGAIQRTYIGAMTEEQISQFTLELISGLSNP